MRIKDHLSRELVSEVYFSNNIIYEKSESYLWFVLSLIDLVFDTYLGDDVHTSEDQKLHYNWCWEKTVNAFEKEGLTIQSEELKEYYFDFADKVFYQLPKISIIEDDFKKHIFETWKRIFNMDIEKTRNEIKAHMDVYKLFEKALKKTK